MHLARLYRHRGSYDDFLESKAARLEAEAAQAAADRGKLRQELAWVRRQPKARSTKSKARLDQFEELSARVAESRHQHLRRHLRPHSRPHSHSRPRPTRRTATANAAVAAIGAKQQRLGGVLVRCEGVTIDTPRGDPLLRAFDYDFQRHERVGIIGPNGAGKTTLLRVLLGEFEQKIAEGSITRGDTVRFAHFDQAGLRAPGDMRVQQFVAEAVAAGPGGGSRDETDRKATRMLNRFLFPPGRWHERVERLSGGERRRLR